MRAEDQTDEKTEMQNVRNAAESRGAELQADFFETPRLAVQTQTRCRVCGFAEVRTDEVRDLYLAECPRCTHRWTSREPIGPALPIATPERLVGARFHRVPPRVARPIAPAA